MKFTICLFALLATICCIQAHLLTATLSGKYNDEIATNGTIIITIFGEKNNKVFTYNKSFLKSLQFQISTEFEDKFKFATVYWESKSGKPFYLNNLGINIDEGKYKHIYTKEKNLESEHSELFY